MLKKLFAAVAAAVCVLLLFAACADDDTADGTANVYAANWYNVTPTGSNMTNAFSADNCIIIEKAEITKTELQNDGIAISGKLNGMSFEVTGEFCSISDNGCVYVYDASDASGNYRVVFCTSETDISKSGLFFNSDEILQTHKTVTKLYLAPLSDGSDFDYCTIEIFDTPVPEIAQQTIDDLPLSHSEYQYWYVKEFSTISY